MTKQTMAWLAGGLVGLALAGTTPVQAQTRAELMAAHRGGTMRMLANSAAGSIDPMINYTQQYWQFYQMTYDSLLSMKKAAGPAAFEIVPNLAEALPEITDGGKTYRFKLRDGIKFSNGEEVGTADVLASFQRIFKISGPTSGTFYAGIVGAEACLKEPATCTLAGGVEIDAASRAVTIRLTAPDPEFVYKIAIPHASILPAATPATDAGTTPIPGTGAYMIASYDPNERVRIIRNPHFKEWSVDAQPDGYPDQFDFDFGLTEEAQVTAVANGQADWMYEQPPADRLVELGTKYAKQVHVSPLAAFWYVPLNTRLPPFDDLRVRQAVNYAVDRKAIINIFGGASLGQPTCQILPPGFPGNQPYCPWTKNPGTTWSAPDLDKAKALVAESGTAGQKVTIVPEDANVSRNIAIYLQSLLTDLGYEVAVQPVSSNIQFTYIQNTNNKVQMSVSQWYQDYPAASDFLQILFSCASFHEASDSSVNISGFCDPKVEAKMQEAITMAGTDAKASNAIWAEVDRMVTDAAVVVPLFNPKRVDFTSKRLGNFVFSGVFNLQLAQVWLQ